jgi:ParB family chromosome partitioning protein
MSKTDQKKLGKDLEHLGVSALLGKTERKKNIRQIISLPLECCHPGPWQPRTDFSEEELSKLAQSIRANGVIQPILVKPKTDQPNHYDIIAGERRWQASKIAKCATIDAIVKEGGDDQSLKVTALIENLQREDLNPIDQANGLQTLIDEHHLSHQKLSTLIGLSRSQVTNVIRLTQLCNEVKQMIQSNHLSGGHARCLVGLAEEKQIQLAMLTIRCRWSVRQLERYIKKVKTKKSVAKVINNTDIESIRRILDCPIHVEKKSDGSGKFIIKFNNQEDMNELLSKLKLCDQD